MSNKKTVAISMKVRQSVRDKISRLAEKYRRTLTAQLEVMVEEYDEARDQGDST